MCTTVGVEGVYYTGDFFLEQHREKKSQNRRQQVKKCNFYEQYFSTTYTAYLFKPRTIT